MKKRFAVIDCEDGSEWQGHHHIWIASVGCDRESWEHFKAYNDELPNLAEGRGFTGVLVTGSQHTAYSTTEKWIARVIHFLKDVVTNYPTVKVFGGCFGSQVLALAMGGRVGKNPGGKFVVGSEELVLTDWLQSRSDFVYAVANSRATGGKGLGGSMAVVVSHADQVLELPAGAQLLASSKSAAAEIWSHGTNVLAVQGHPEMTSALCITKVVPALVAKGLITAAEGEAAVASLQTPPAAAALMLNMAKYFLRGHPPRGGAAEAAAAAVRLFGPSSLPADPIPSRGVLASFMGGMGRDTSGSHVGGDDGGTATLRTLMDEMFHKVTAAVTGELQATANEYHLLRDMNLVASDKYQQMGDFAEGMLVFVERMQAKEEALKPYIDQIDDIDAHVADLEAVVAKLDLYTRRMEAQFRVLLAE